MTELRARRRMCDEVETELSYYRRLLHGRMDLLAFEMSRRRGEDDRTLLEALPEILAGQEAAPPSAAGRQLPVAIPDLAGEGRRAVDRALADDFLTRLPTLDDAELERIQALLAETEREVSASRRKVYEACEQVQIEVTRRYREGLADIDDLLKPS